jgi:hypothetical protein
MIPGWISHIELDWEEPTWVRWCGRMISFARLVRFDKRGTGLSDRPARIPTLAERMADALAVLDARKVLHEWSLPRGTLNAVAQGENQVHPCCGHDQAEPSPACNVPVPRSFSFWSPSSSLALRAGCKRHAADFKIR